GRTRLSALASGGLVVPPPVPPPPFWPPPPPNSPVTPPATPFASRDRAALPCPQRRRKSLSLDAPSRSAVASPLGAASLRERMPAARPRSSPRAASTNRRCPTRADGRRL